MYNGECSAGHATLLGKNTKKCVGYAIKGKGCRICDVAKEKGVSPRTKTVHVMGLFYFFLYNVQY